MRPIIRALLKAFLQIYFRVKVRGLEHYHQAKSSDKPLLIIANHISFLDGIFIDLFIPGKTYFLVDEQHTKKWIERFVLSFGHYFALDIHSPHATKTIIKRLEAGDQCMIFPEGRISTTGAIMKVYPGTGVVLDITGANALPVMIQGLDYTRFSYLDGSHGPGLLRRRWRPQVSLTLQPAQTLSLPSHLKGHERHRLAALKVQNLLINTRFLSECIPGNMSQLWRRVHEANPKNREVIADAQGRKLNSKQFNQGMKVLGRKFQNLLAADTTVAVMLPNASGTAVTFFALQLAGKIPVMINFTAGSFAIISALRTAKVAHLLTSHAFIEGAKLQHLMVDIEQEVRVIYLEDLRQSLTLGDKLGGIFKPYHSFDGMGADIHDPAVVLFTSGSEGHPKGVVLSHNNLWSNVNQANSLIRMLDNDRVFNALPTFHCFGLTAGMLWPLLKGVRTFMYPSPIHYNIVPEMVYQTNATMVFGTDTFYKGYARNANDFDFMNVRYLIAGAEKLKPETQAIYFEKFNQYLYQGYGVTETTPVIAVNHPVARKPGSVGQAVPQLQWRLEPVAGISEGGRLFVKGPNVMLGYWFADNPGVLVAPEDGWHDTGDIVKVDDEGFFFILGRAKRFAKIGGEMISLTAVEGYIQELDPEAEIAAVAVADPRKGEQIILVTTSCSLNKDQIRQAAQSKGLSELLIPRTIILVESLPILGTGKVNYPKVQEIANSHYQSP